MTHEPPVLLAHSYYLCYDPKQVGRMKPYAPLATLIAAAVLRKQGHDVRFFDAMLAPGVETFRRHLAQAAPRIVAILEDGFNFLTKMCTLRMREAACEMIREAGSAGARVVVNGPDATDHPDLYLAAGADAVIVGEAELTVAEVVRRWTEHPNQTLEDVRGLILPSVNGGGPRRTAPRAHIEDLDALPFPAWDLVDVEQYRDVWVRAHGRLSWNIVTSRGCPYRCNWCAKPQFASRYTQRSPNNVAEELAGLRASVNPDHVWFADDVFGLTGRWIEAFADEVAARDARIPFMVQSRANLMKPRTVEALTRAGAEEVWMGVESGSQRVLDAMDKDITVEQVRVATRTLRAHGVRSCWFIQLGYLGEEWEDVLLTRDLIREERPDDIGVSVSYPLPGTKFYQIVRDQLGAKQNWVDSDDLDMMFVGAFPTDFYKGVRTLLHEEVRTGQHLDAGWADLARRARDRRV